jgi:hypothetical protein
MPIIKPGQRHKQNTNTVQIHKNSANNNNNNNNYYYYYYYYYYWSPPSSLKSPAVNRRSCRQFVTFCLVLKSFLQNPIILQVPNIRIHIYICVCACLRACACVRVLKLYRFSSASVVCNSYLRFIGSRG